MNQFWNKRETLKGYRDLREKHGKKMSAFGERLKMLFDGGDYTELFAEMETDDPLGFPGYAEKLKRDRISTGSKDACVAGVGTIKGIPCLAAEVSKEFMMGSMGTVVGEKIAECFEEADRLKLPVVIFSASGGARMQEGMFSLMQMAKTSAAAERFKNRGGLYISVLTHPTTGGVSASYANLGDVILAEPGALIGFAGPRVIEQTIGEKLPRGFQRAEFQKEHGFVDKIVEKQDMKNVIADLLLLHEIKPGRTGETDGADMTEGGEANVKNMSAAGEANTKDMSSGSEINKREIRKREGSGRKRRTPYERVQMARHKDRPKAQDFIEGLFEGFVELSGDRLGKEDSSIVGGIALFHGRPVTVIGHRKGKNLQENMKYNFGMPGPEGYRKALRMMRQAEKFHRPVIAFIDTPGAYPGKEAEENGQSTAIAENLAAMSSLKTPFIAIVTGEGNSGGALAISMGDEIWMLENAVYSVLSPEGFASILWKDASRSREACEVMKMTAAELYKAGLADRVIPEPPGGLRIGRKENRRGAGDAAVRENRVRETGTVRTSKDIAGKKETEGKKELSGRERISGTEKRDVDLPADFADVCENMGELLDRALKKYERFSADELMEHRYMKYRNIAKTHSWKREAETSVIYKKTI